MHRQTKKDGAIAQLVEQRTENPCVPRSIRGGTTERESYSNATLSLFYVFFYAVTRWSGSSGLKKMRIESKSAIGFGDNILCHRQKHFQIKCVSFIDWDVLKQKKEYIHLDLYRGKIC